jgi:uncharacterized protein YfaS (alpha-2-macroglobulin family)
MRNNLIFQIAITIKAYFSMLFGRFSWQLPPWLRQLDNERKTNPRTFWALLASILILLGLIGYGIHWYKSLPQPMLVVGQIVVPQSTPVDKILVPDVLAINFGDNTSAFTTQSVAPLNKIGKEITTGVSMTPAVKGKWQWQTDSHLVFTPAEDWPAGQEYKIHFDRNFFSTTTKMQTYNYSFATQPFQIDIAEFKFYQDPLDAQVRQAVATLKFNYPVDATSLEDKISLLQQTLYKTNTPSYKLTVTYDEHKREAYVHSESLPITKVERFLELTIAKGVKALYGPGKTTTDLTQKLLIPDASSYFKLNSVKTSIVRNERDIPEQILAVETTVGVTEAALTKSLHAYLLPRDYPATATQAEKKAYHWHTPGEVTAAILALATPVNLTALPAEHNYAMLHTYQFKADAPRYIYLTVDKGLTSFGNFVLTNNFATIVRVPKYPKEIRFLHQGALLALNSEKKLSVGVRGLAAVKFQIARVLSDNVNQLITQTRGDFNNPSFINSNFNQDNISEISTDIQPFDASDLAKEQYTALDVGKYLSVKNNSAGPQGLFLLTASGWDSVNQTVLDVKSSRLILITNLGLVVKDNNDGTHDVFVQSITEGKPVANATVSLLGKNGLPILKRTTDTAGHVLFPTVKDFVDEREPTVYTAQLANDVAFIPYNSPDRQLNFSRYDVGGVYDNAAEQKSLTAYVFSDRGIYRPGDTAHVSFIVKQNYAGAEPAGLPLEVMITDPRGNVVKNQKFVLEKTGLHTLDFITHPTTLTGHYMINLFIVKDNHPSSLLGSAEINVAEFLPDTMRIKAQLSESVSDGWVDPSKLVATVNVWNLYGAPATERNVTAKLLLTPQPVVFSAYPNYVFADPLLDPAKPPKVFTDTLTEIKTNEQGSAQFDLKLDRFEKATYRLTFFAEGFTAGGGRSVTTQTSVLVSPLTYLIGYKTDGALNYLKQKDVRRVNFIAVNPQLHSIAETDLKIQLLALHPVSTLVKKPDGTYQYQSVVQTSTVSTKAFALAIDGTEFVLPTDQIGEFALVVLDKNNTELNRVAYNVVGDSQQPLPKNAELTVKLNKTTFLPDSDIEMQITAPYTGSGLITIERDKVYAVQWFQTNTTSSIQKIHIPKDFQGNGYVNVAFIRDWNSDEIFMNPLSYSIAPFNVDHANRALNIDLAISGVARPGEAFKIFYKSDKPGKMIVFAVDEGILQAAKYKTPDPLAFFFQKRALEVSTQQIIDQILPKFIQARELSAVGGDGSAANTLKIDNPFKRKTDLPVAYWSGIVDTDTSVRELTYTIPDYFNGTLRVMAVGVSEDAVGAATQSAEVRGNFIITPTIPTFVAPDDEFEITTSVANNVAGSGENAIVDVQLQTTPGLQVIGPEKQSLKIAEGKEQTLHFKLRARAVLGSANVTLLAINNNKMSKITSSVSVRPGSVYTTNVMSGALRGEKTVSVDSHFYPEHRTLQALISSSPLILITGLQRYLVNFPYACTEQLISKALPFLALANQSWYTKKSPDTSAKVQLAIQALAERQLSSGGFAYWPNVEMNDSNEFASVYALHFLTESSAEGFDVSIDMMQSGISYLKEIASKKVSTLAAARIQAYAIYILTRNEIVTTNYLTNLQLYLDQDKQKKWRNDITSAYIAASYKLLKSDDEANRLIAYYKPQQEVIEATDFYNKNIADAQYLYLLARHFPDQFATMKDSLVLSVVNALNSEDMTTILSGYSSLALAAVPAQRFSTNNLKMTTVLANGNQNVLAATDNDYQEANVDVGAKKIIFAGPTQMPSFYQFIQAGFDISGPQSVVKNGLEIDREYRDAKNNKLNAIGLGDEIEVHIQVRTTNHSFLNNIAIIDLLPGGFEVVRDSVTNSAVDYVDAREDRVIFFASVGPDMKEIIYRIKAINIGKYSVPAIVASSMYNPKIFAHNIASVIIVKQ